MSPHVGIDPVMDVPGPICPMPEDLLSCGPVEVRHVCCMHPGK
jgi:hypothetical protein